MADNRTISRPEFLIDGSDEAFRDFIYDFLIVSSRMDAIRDRIGDLLGLSGFQYHVLSVVSELEPKGPVSVGDVAHVLHAKNAYVTMETGKLEKLGLISKKTNPADRRGVLLKLTKAGSKAINAIIPSRRTINDVLFKDLGPADFRAFRKIMDQMTGNTMDALETAQEEVSKKRHTSKAA